jgi:glycosyltransferase involved in cell wall biosynthesis
LDSNKAMGQPLVSVGMPVYNRPEGLRRALDCLTRQTYRNIEIIVSDNCSPDAKVKEVVEEYMLQDKRISYYRQNSSLGIIGNFKFVLEKADGEYFMWAADDDEWRPEFINLCIQPLLDKDVVSVMSNFSTLYRQSGEIVKGQVPSLSSNIGMAGNILAFLDCMTPSLFYGIHKRRYIMFFLKDSFFDFYDCYFILRLMLQGEVKIIEPELYIAGVDAPSYQLKPAKKYRFTKLKYSSFLFKSLESVLTSKLDLTGKVKVVTKLLQKVISMFLFHEIRGALK